MKTSFFAFFIFFFASAQAQEQVIYHDLAYRGAGCPEGSVSTSVSPDGSSLSILFDEFRISLPEDGGQVEERGRGIPRAPRRKPGTSMKDCMLRFSASLPIGVRVEAVEISVQARGSTILDPGIRAGFSSMLVGYNGLAQMRGRIIPLIQKEWNSTYSPVQDDWLETPVATVPLLSSCARREGRTISFDMKNFLTGEIIGGDLRKQGLITVDSADTTGMLKVSLRLRSCGGAR